MNAMMSVNGVAVFVVTLIGFLFGWLWHSPVLFAKPWMAELKISEEKAKAMPGKDIAAMMIKGFLMTLVSTTGLAILFSVIGTAGGMGGLKMGAFVGLMIVGSRVINSGIWEQRSCKLNAINVGHEVGLYALQGAILGAWN